MVKSIEPVMGRIHSIQSMSTHDGPGIRSVVFFQGCPLRCDYCHNPDTWDPKEGIPYGPQALVTKLQAFKPYYEASSGGVTFSGGEPLMQGQFLYETLKVCKEKGLHTAIETSGYGLDDPHLISAILACVDLVILDIKAFEETHFTKALKKSQTPLWLRFVLLPQVSNQDTVLEGVKQLARSYPTLEKVEGIPYHDLGVHKYKALGLTYPLKDLKRPYW